jgi:methyl coenzyme M reductase subunit C-like uncharacterized protein (methanogenesis marker protein 7)
MNKHEAIYKLYPNVKYINDEISYDVNNNVVTIDNALVEAEVAKHAYIPQRAAEYPSIQDQLDTLYHEGYDGWKAKIQAVKNKYPKGA